MTAELVRIDMTGAVSGSHVRPQPLPVPRPATHPAVLPLHIALLSLVAIVALAAITLRLHEPRQNHTAIAVACGLAVIVLIVYGRYVLQRPWLSASLVYLMLFWMFHYGLAFTAVVVPDVLTSMDDVAVLWLYRPAVRLTLILGVLGAAGFLLGVGLLTEHPPGHVDVETLRRAHDPGLYTCGWLLMLVGLAGTAVTLLAHGGVGVFAMGYQVFRQEVLATTQLQTLLDTSQLGCLLALCGAGRRRWVVPLLVWSPVAVAMLLIGLRTEAMVPLVTFAIVLTCRGIALHRGVLAAAVVASLIVIPAVRVIRLVGFEHRSSVRWMDVSPLETLTELGITLRAAKAYVDRIEAGDEHLLGASYWAPFDRQLLVRVIPDREQIPFNEDVRVPSRLLPLHEGAVGESSIGEAYYNFGAIGPLIYFGCVGALFGWLERRAAASLYYCALLGIAINIFYFNIRGHWIAVPAQVAGGVAALVACKAVNLFVLPASTAASPAGEASSTRAF
jgi:hypothetical protein